MTLHSDTVELYYAAPRWLTIALVGVCVCVCVCVFVCVGHRRIPGTPSPWQRCVEPRDSRIYVCYNVDGSGHCVCVCVCAPATRRVRSQMVQIFRIIVLDVQLSPSVTHKTILTRLRCGLTSRFSHRRPPYSFRSRRRRTRFWRPPWCTTHGAVRCCRLRATTTPSYGGGTSASTLARKSHSMCHCFQLHRRACTRTAIIHSYSPGAKYSLGSSARRWLLRLVS